MTTFCFYHKVDLDGQSSAAIVKRFLPETELRPFNYHEVFPWDEIKPEDTVYMVDVTLQPYDRLADLYGIVGDKLCICDHHKSFLESDAYKFLSEKIPHRLRCSTLVAGCELTWHALSDGEPMPRAVHLLGQYDSWRDAGSKKLADDFDWDEEVMPFQFGMRLERFNPLEEEDREKFMKLCEDAGRVDEIIERGKIVLKYQDNQNRYAMNSSFDAKIKGCKCLCLNGGMRNSRVFASKWDNEKYDYMVAFSMNKNQDWSWSFYTDRPDRDAGSLAGQFGGGGHAGAAGCVTEALIFD